MTPWRDTTPQAAQDELDATLVAAIDVAVDLLAKSPELRPFAVLHEGDGFALSVDPEAWGEGDAAVAEIARAVRSHRDGVRAAALVVDSLVDGSDALQVWLEHPDPLAPALRVVMPYRRHDGEVEVGPPTLVPGTARIWD
jgi:hypothetical protein